MQNEKGNFYQNEGLNLLQSEEVLIKWSPLQILIANDRTECIMHARIQKFFKGGLRRKILKEKCLLIHVSTRVYIKTRQRCNSFSLLPFQEDYLLFFALFFVCFGGFFVFFYMYHYGNWLLNKPNFVSLFSTSGQRFFKLTAARKYVIFTLRSLMQI